MNSVILYAKFKWSGDLYIDMIKAMDLTNREGLAYKAECKTNHLYGDEYEAGNEMCEFHFPLANKDVGEKFAKRLRKLGIKDVSVRQIK